MLAIPGGGDIYYLHERDALLRDAAASPSLLLHHSAKTRRDHLLDFEMTALMWIIIIGWLPIGFVAFALMEFLIWLLLPAYRYVDSDWRFLWGLGGTVLLCWLTMKFFAWQRDLDSVNWGWEKKKWIDVDRRLFVHQLETFGKAPSVEQTVKPLDELVLYGSTNNMSDVSDSYEIDLIMKSSVPPRRALTDPPVLCCLYSGDTEEDARAIGQELAKLWNIPFFERFT